MRINNNLAKQFAVIAAVTALCGTSAIAETRHHDETKGTNERSHVERSNRGERNRESVQVEQQRSNNNTQLRSGNNNRSYDRNNDRNWNNNNRNNDRNWNSNNNRSNDRNWNNNNRNNNNYNNRGHYDSYRGRTPYFHNGRIDRFERWNGGFRVYIGGAPYPFFVPEAYFRSHGFRVGLSIRLGGYYNPLGYYDYYDDPYYYGGGYSTPVASGDIRGVVQEVDFRRDTLVVRDDQSGEFITTVMRGRDRTFETLRPGDVVLLRGDWIRGTFEAYRADLLDGRGYDSRY